MPERRERGMNLKAPRFFLAALLAAGAATFLLAVLRKRQAESPAIPCPPPEGGEREEGFELFIGS
ncbi:MAG: hypothetical protein HW408_579 [Actinobacteria bacterium]|nr:hypothetical protein [Actinomycetota bacterium]